jgi:hypothetical protein
MSARQLRAEYERLVRQIADAMADQQADGPEYRQLLERLRA